MLVHGGTESLRYSEEERFRIEVLYIEYGSVGELKAIVV